MKIRLTRQKSDYEDKNQTIEDKNQTMKTKIRL